MNVASVLSILSAFSWLVFVGAILYSGFSASRGRPIKGIIGLLAAVAIVAVVLTTLSSGLVFVQPEERGVVISAVAPKGYREQALEPGLHWIIPYFENVIFYPISRQTYTMSIAPGEGQIQGDDSITARTSDGQEVLVDASVIYAIDPNEVTQVHIEWQKRYSDDLIRPISRGVIRDTISQFRVDQVYSTKRVELISIMNKAMAEKLSENGLVLFDFVLRNITFSPEYAASVEQKQIAEQQAQQAKFVVEQRKQEAEQARQVAEGKADAAVISAEGAAKSRLINAKAEADALKLIADALKGQPDLLTYQYITNLAPNVQVMFVPSNNPFILPLPSAAAPLTQSLLQSGESSPSPVPSPTPVQ